jgi:hypothetical protein
LDRTAGACVASNLVRRRLNCFALPGQLWRWANSLAHFFRWRYFPWASVVTLRQRDKLILFVRRLVGCLRLKDGQ